MKTGKLLTALLLLLIYAGMAECESEKERDKTVTNLNGIVYFNQDVQKWYISTHKEGTYDEVLLLFPGNLEEAYKVEGKKVLFSGTIFDLLLDLKDLPAGSSYVGIEISSIEDLP